MILETASPKLQNKVGGTLNHWEKCSRFIISPFPT